MVDITAHNALPLTSLHPFLPLVSEDVPITLYTSVTLPPARLTACFDLVRTNMRAMYRRSEMGWNSKDKREEMEDADMRYLILSGSGPGDEVEGFLSFMVTEEEGEEVIYWYFPPLSFPHT